MALIAQLLAWLNEVKPFDRTSHNALNLWHTVSMGWLGLNLQLDSSMNIFYVFVTFMPSFRGISFPWHVCGPFSQSLRTFFSCNFWWCKSTIISRFMVDEVGKQNLRNIQIDVSARVSFLLTCLSFTPNHFHSCREVNSAKLLFFICAIELLRFFFILTATHNLASLIFIPLKWEAKKIECEIISTTAHNSFTIKKRLAQKLYEASANSFIFMDF